ncbi:MAG: nitrite/sulfite reductase [Chloroflexi bacterium]|nr:nitrite/sulfite reductase [Chloroflexota bacterium]
MFDATTLLVEPALDTSLVSASEIERTRNFIADYTTGRMDGDCFRRFRLQNGIYGIRGQTDIQMVRIKIPFGRLTAHQLGGLGRAAETYARGVGHVTTRQDVQLYWVAVERVADLLADLGAVGLTTRESSGNVARNVTADALAGVAPDEAFDVRPYANTVARFLLRNPIALNLPRKFKIAFSGSPADRAVTAIHDIGALAVIRQSTRGFQIYVGGGLGSNPHAGQLLEDFTPETNLLPTVEAVVRVFDRLGNRQTKAKARLKFLVEQLGIQPFRDLVFKERTALPLVRPQPYPAFDADPDRVGWLAAPQVIVRHGNGHNGDQDAGYARWLESSVVRQKQPGFAAVSVALPGGDVTSSQFHALATIARDWARGECFTTVTQNIVLRWVREDALSDVYRALRAIGLGEAGAERLWDVVGCAGADTCNTAITTSHRLALALGDRLRARPDLYLAPDLRGIDIKVSGCPNSCGLHHVAAIGFYGGARRVNGLQTPQYMMLLGGRVLPGRVIFGKNVTSIPAKRVPQAVERVIDLYRAGRQDTDETFHDWLDRVGLASLKGQFEDLRNLPDPNLAPDLYRDWSQDFEFKLQVGEAECAV